MESFFSIRRLQLVLETGDRLEHVDRRGSGRARRCGGLSVMWPSRMARTASGDRFVVIIAIDQHGKEAGDVALVLAGRDGDAGAGLQPARAVWEALAKTGSGISNAITSPGAATGQNAAQ